tara:strand:+ start:195 stop:2042 length:1848 start_codon:yes stop_codon:yes gene_type:complete
MKSKIFEEKKEKNPFSLIIEIMEMKRFMGLLNEQAGGLARLIAKAASSNIDEVLPPIKKIIQRYREKKVDAAGFLDEYITAIKGTVDEVNFYKALDNVDEVKKYVDEWDGLIDKYLKDPEVEVTKEEFIAFIKDPKHGPNTGNDVIDEYLTNKVMKILDDTYDEVVPIVSKKIKPVKSSVSNITKSMGEVVDEITDEEIELLNKKLGKGWSNIVERLKTIINPYLKKVTTLQDEIIKDIALWKKATPNVKPILRKRIIAQLEVLEVRSADLLEATDSWIETQIRPLAVKDPSVRSFYNKVKKREGWARIKVLSKLWKGAGIGMRDIFTNNGILRNAWLKVGAKPITLPVNLIRKILNRGEKFEWIGKLTKEESKAFYNWFLTTNPAGWKAVQQVFVKEGYFAGASYVFAQALYRYWFVSTMLGVARTLGALSAEGIDLASGYFGVNTNISDSPITNYLFGSEKLDELSQTLVDNKGGDISEYVQAFMDMVGEQSAPFRNWVGVWPAVKVSEQVGVLAMAIFDKTLDDKIQELDKKVKEAEADVVEIADKENIPLPGQDNQGDNSTSVQSGTIEDAAKQLGVNVEQVTQDGDIFIWSMDGQEIGRYKMINGKLEIQ